MTQAASYEQLQESLERLREWFNDSQHRLGEAITLLERWLTPEQDDFDSEIVAETEDFIRTMSPWSQ